MKYLLLLAMLSLALASCGDDDPRYAPFGVPWGSDTVAARQLLGERELRPDPDKGGYDNTFERTYLSFSGREYLGVGGTNHASYGLEFRRNALVSAGTSMSFRDSVDWARAVRRITEMHDEWWTAGRNDQVRSGKQPGTYRIWLPVDSVSSVIWFARPEHEDDQWYINVGYDRVIPESPLNSTQ